MYPLPGMTSRFLALISAGKSSSEFTTCFISCSSDSGSTPSKFTILKHPHSSHASISFPLSPGKSCRSTTGMFVAIAVKSRSNYLRLFILCDFLIGETTSLNPCRVLFGGKGIHLDRNGDRVLEFVWGWSAFIHEEYRSLRQQFLFMECIYSIRFWLE